MSSSYSASRFAAILLSLLGAAHPPALQADPASPELTLLAAAPSRSRPATWQSQSLPAAASLPSATAVVTALPHSAAPPPASPAALPSLHDILNSTQLDAFSGPAPHGAAVAVLDVSPAAPLRQSFTTGPGVSRIVRIALWCPGWDPTWPPDRSLVLTLYHSGSTAPVARAVEPYSRRQWEGAIHQFELDAPAAPGQQYSFELSVQGGAGPLHGIGWLAEAAGTGTGPLQMGDGTRPGALWFQVHVKRSADENQLYRSVFAHFNLDRPDLAAVRAAVNAADWPRARTALVAHFEQKLAAPQAPTALTPASRRAADLAVAGKLQAADGELVDLGPRWNHMASWKARGGVGLTRSGLRSVLAQAYRATHDERYARAWNAMLRYQFEDLPSPLRSGVIPPGASGIPPVFDDGIAGGSMWAALSIGARMTHGFTYYRAFLHSPSFDADTRFAFLVNLAEMSDVLPILRGGGNWEAQRTTALFEFAQEFPEFRQAKQWLHDGFEGAVASCLQNTYPDGPLREATINYHNLSLNRYLGVLESSRSLGLTPPPAMRERVERMLDYEMLSTMPGGELPLWGDSNPWTTGSSLLQRGAAFFHRPDYLWVATGGRQGTRPSVTSAAFPIAGYYIFRSGWSPTALFLAVHNGASSAHGHADANSLVLAANGAELLIDPGVYIYGTPESDQLHRSISHNTVTMDDRDSLNDGGKATFVPGSALALYEGLGPGFEGDRSATHRRQVIVVGTDLLLVIDDMHANSPHTWTARFHAPPGEIRQVNPGLAYIMPATAGLGAPTHSPVSVTAATRGSASLPSPPAATGSASTAASASPRRPTAAAPRGAPGPASRAGVRATASGSRQSPLSSVRFGRPALVVFSDHPLTLTRGLAAASWEMHVNTGVLACSATGASARLVNLLVPFTSAPARCSLTSSSGGAVRAAAVTSEGCRCDLLVAGPDAPGSPASPINPGRSDTSRPPGITPSSRDALSPSPRLSFSPSPVPPSSPTSALPTERSVEAGLESDASAAVVRSANGKVQSAALIHGRSLRWRPASGAPTIDLVEAAAPAASLSAHWDGKTLQGGTLQVELAQGSARVATRGARRLQLNGQPVLAIPPGAAWVSVSSTAQKGPG